MPDTPIDQSTGIQSIRLKIPTGTVPVPPAGFGQLHSPSPGTLALRLPDGSVVTIGGGGGGANAVNLLGPNGQVLTNGSEPGVGIDVSPIPGLATRISGDLQGTGGLLYPPPPAVVTVTATELLNLHVVPKVLVAAPSPTKLVWPRLIFELFLPGSIAYAGIVDFVVSYAFGSDLNTLSDDLTNVVTERDEPAAAAVGSVSDGSVLSAERLAEWLGQPLILYTTGPLTLGNGALRVITDYLPV